MFVMAVAVCMHFLFLCFNTIVVSKHVMNFSPKQAISVVIMASQKSSPVALAVITSLATTNPQQKGLFALPCIIGQLSQIFIGSFIAGRLAKWVGDDNDGEAVGDIVNDPVLEMVSVVEDDHISEACKVEVTELTSLSEDNKC
jgi:predicted Na+-dependent transporter